MNDPTQTPTWRSAFPRSAFPAAILFLLALAAAPALAQGYGITTLDTFTFANGSTPVTGLIRDNQGNLYGTTDLGGDGSQSGVVFKIDSSGTATILHLFTGQGGDGANSEGRLLRDAAGNLYGMTARGGDLSCFEPEGNPGCGTIFKISPGGQETILYTFTQTEDIVEPRGGLVADLQGNFYGLTMWGGNITSCGGYGCGTVFKLDTAGNFTVLYKFVGSGQGQNPLGTLARDAQGNLYGTLVGTGDRFGDGTVYKLDPSGNFSTIYSFKGSSGNDGFTPVPGLVFDAQGILYGSTLYGGTGLCTFGCGTLFKLTSSGGAWTETVLYNLAGGAAGDVPNGDLLVDAQGNVYGSTISGGSDEKCVLNGAFGCGVVFKVDATGHETVLYNFVPGVGLYANSNGGLVLDPQGNIFGTTAAGGSQGLGTVYELKPAPSTTTTISVPSSSTYGVFLTMTAAVTSSIGAPPDGESVAFQASNTVLGTGTLSGGSASFGTSTLSAGTYSITASYFGDPTLAGSTSSPSTLAVAKASSTTTLTSSVNPSQVGQFVTFTATVSPEFGGDSSGNVTFYDGATQLAQVGFGGYAQYTTAALALGTHTITAVYGGNNNLLGSSSNVLKQVVVNTAATTTTLTSSPNPSILGQTVTMTATVSSLVNGTPTGSVTFYNGTTALATETLTNASAVYTTSALPLGSNSLTAVYSGDSKYTGSTSAPLQQLVQNATAVLLSSNLNPSTYGQAVTLAATVSSRVGPPPDGDAVTFMNGTATLGTCFVTQGSCTFATTTLPAGAIAIHAVFGGDTDFAGSQSKVLRQTVTKATTTTVLISSPNPSSVGQPVTFTATVTAQFGGTITGTVTFYDGAMKLKGVPVSGAVAQLTTSKLKAGTHSITAKYNGSHSLTGSTSAAVIQKVN